MRLAAKQNVVSWTVAALLLLAAPTARLSACCCTSTAPDNLAATTEKAGGCCQSAGKSRDIAPDCGRCGIRSVNGNIGECCPCSGTCSNHDPDNAAELVAVSNERPSDSCVLLPSSGWQPLANSDHLGTGILQEPHGYLPLSSPARCALLSRFLL